jgi:simple sugar transport system ATP-binding protein
VTETSYALMEAKGLRKSYAGVEALRGANFELRRGEIHAVVGDNGAGKSTFIKILSGAVQPDDGQILIDGNPIVLHSPKAAQDFGIATVFQDLALINHLDVGSNIYLGRELRRRAPLSWLGVLDKKEMRKRAAEDLRLLQVNVTDVDQIVLSMSGGQRQAVAVARAVAFGTRLVIMDEPTAALGIRESGAVLEVMKRIKKQGIAIIMISHKLPEVLEVADRITVMRLGTTLKCVAKADTDLTEIVGMMTGAFQG